MSYIPFDANGSKKFSKSPRISATCALSLSSKSFNTTARYALISSGVRIVSTNGRGAGEKKLVSMSESSVLFRVEESRCGRKHSLRLFENFQESVFM